MMHEEFEKLAGYQVSYKDYSEIIEPMYMAVNLTKQEFVKIIDKKRFALKTRMQLIRELRKLAQKLYEVCGYRRDHETEDKFEDLFLELQNRFEPNAYIEKGYEYPGMRGCSYPQSIRFFNDSQKPIQLVVEE